MKKLLVALLLLPALALASPVPKEAEQYKRAPKYFETYPDGAAGALVIGCSNGEDAEAPGNVMACLCATWNLMEHYSFPQLKALNPDPAKAASMASDIFDGYVRSCVKKHPLPPKK